MRAKAFTNLAFAVLATGFLYAQDAAKDAPKEGAEAEAPAENVELENEIKYITALVDAGYPDFAAPVIEAVRKKWPESEARLFAIDVRSLLSLGKFEEAEKKIASLPDRKSAKYWAARLEMAQNLFVRGQKPECMKIYEEFFKVFAKPPKEIRKFYLDASYTYGQLLALDKKYEQAAERYAVLFSQLPKGSDEWCTIGCETVDLYLRLAEDDKDPKKGKARAASLKAADKIVDQLLWMQGKPLIFGRAVAMKAHIAQMQGQLEKAEAIIDEYRDQLEDIHGQILAVDPEGKYGLLRQSPLPECLFLQAKMLWDAAQAEYKQTKRDDEKIKSYMFGPKDKASGKRQTSKGAYAMAQLVFLEYSVSSWAAEAGEMAQAIAEFATQKYKAKVKCAITPEQIARARAQQFAEANEKFVTQDLAGAVKAYYVVLGKCPEQLESIPAIENLASALLDLLYEEKDEAKKADLRLDADAVEGYLGERFAGNRNRAVMMAAGDATLRLAAKEQERKNLARADALYTAFCTNYRKHPNAAGFAASKAGEFQKAGRYDDAIKFLKLIGACYTNSIYYAGSLYNLSECYARTGDKTNEIAYMKKYLGFETVKLRRLQAQFNLAQMYQKDGVAKLAQAAELTEAAEVEALEKAGTAQIIRAVQNFQSFAKEADAEIADPATSKDDKKKYEDLREAAKFMVGVCWSRMNRPADKLEAFRKRAVAGYEAYAKDYPEGKYAKVCYVHLGTIYTALGDMAKSKEALDKLSQKFPDSDEAKNAKPRLAKNLIEMGMKKEGAEIYAEMLRTDGAYTAGQFVNAGEALIDGKSWDLAGQAFEKAIRLAGTNSATTVAKARLGMAKCAWKQGSLAEAREALDLFLSDPKISKMAIAADANFMLVEVASDQGRVEKDATLRGKCFGAAIGALKKVRQYWSRKPQWEQDKLDLLSGDVLVDRMHAEEAMGLKEAALETCGRAAATFQVFIQSHGPTESHPFDKMEPGELENLERAYATIVPLFAKMGSEKADLVVRFGQEYLDYFPNGKSRTMISNSINQAKADLPAAQQKKAAAAEAAAATAAATEAPQP